MDPHMIAAALMRLRYKVWGFGESIAMEALLRSGGAPADFAANLSFVQSSLAPSKP